MALSDVTSSDLIASARANEIKDKIYDGTDDVNCSNLQIAGTDIIDSSRNIADGETGAHTIGTAAQTTFYGDGSNLTGIAGGGIQQYDAVVDAAGNHDYTTIKAAVDANETSIFVMNGTYAESAFTINDNDTMITGESRDGVVIDYGATSGTKITITADNVTIKNLTTENWSSAAAEHVFYITGSYCTLDNIKLKDLTFTYASNSSGPITAITGTNFTIKNCITDNVSSDRRVLKTEQDYSMVFNNYIRNVKAAGASASVMQATGDYSKYFNNVFISDSTTTTGENATIFLYNMNYCLVSNNYIERASGKCITFYSNTGSIVSNSILNNTIYSSGADTGILISGANPSVDFTIVAKNNIVGFTTAIQDNATSNNTVKDTGDRSGAYNLIN